MTEPTRMLSIEVHLDETSDRTDAKATVELRGTHFAGWGRARRNPTDPHVPRIGEELATARALSDLSRNLLDAVAAAIEEREGGPVHLDR